MCRTYPEVWPETNGQHQMIRQRSTKYTAQNTSKNTNMSEQFADMFEKKIQDIVNSTAVENNVYNGTKKINEQCKKFMSESNIRTAILGLKSKRT